MSSTCIWESGLRRAVESPEDAGLGVGHSHQQGFVKLPSKLLFHGVGRIPGRSKATASHAHISAAYVVRSLGRLENQGLSREALGILTGGWGAGKRALDGLNPLCLPSAVWPGTGGLPSLTLVTQTGIKIEPTS